MSNPPQPGIQYLTLALLFAVVLLARRRADVHPAHRAFALGLNVVLLADLMRGLLALAFAVPGPYHGGRRALFHLDEALFLAWPAALAWVALASCTRLHPWRALRWVGAAWALLALALAAFYPTIRGEALAHVYLAAELTALLVATLALARWVRGEGLAKNQALVTVAALAALIAGEFVAVLVGPWAQGLFGAAWTLEHAALIPAYVAIVVLHLAGPIFSP